jgi:pimeloyl-ACP methyl ester carboxylesterase
VRLERSDQIATWRREVRLARHDPPGLAAEVRDRHPGWHERDVAGVVADLGDCRIEPIIDAVKRGAAMVDPTESLVGDVGVPMLLLLADEDRSGLSGASRPATVSRLPAGSQTAALAAGHSIHRDAPDLYLAAALGWLGGPHVPSA